MPYENVLQLSSCQNLHHAGQCSNLSFEHYDLIHNMVELDSIRE